MKTYLKLHFLKQTINLATRVLDRFLKPTDPTHPQTVMLQDLFRNFNRVLQTEKEAKRFPDANFERLLRVAEKTLMYAAEEDRYYKSWLGLAFLLAAECSKRSYDHLSFEEFCEEAKQHWQVEAPISLLVFNCWKEDFYKIHLSDYLHTLSE